MGNTLPSGSRADEEDEAYAGWMEAAGIVTAQSDTVYTCGPVGLPVMPSYTFPPGPYMAASTASQASASVYRTPMEMPAVQAASMVSSVSHRLTPLSGYSQVIDAPEHLPIPLPIVSRPLDPCDTTGVPHTAFLDRLDADVEAQRQRTPSRLSSISDLRRLQTFPLATAHSPATRSAHPSLGFQPSRPSSLRQSSLDSNAQVPRATHPPRNVHFEDFGHEVPDTPLPGLSTFTSPAASVTSELSLDDISTPPSEGGDKPLEPEPVEVNAALHPSACFDSEPDGDGHSDVARRHFLGLTDQVIDPDRSRPEPHPHMRQQLYAILGQAGTTHHLESGVVIPPSPSASYHAGSVDIVAPHVPRRYAPTASVTTAIQPTTVPPSTPEILPFATRSVPIMAPAPFPTTVVPPSPFIPVVPQVPISPTLPPGAGPAGPFTAPVIGGHISPFTFSASGEISHFAGSSPRGMLYQNGAAATGFAVGTPYQTILPPGVTTAAGVPTWNSPMAFTQPRAVHAGQEVILSLRAVHAFRGSRTQPMCFDAQWDDARLLKEMRKTYDKLRSWRKWCSLKSVRSITLVSCRDTFIFPQRIGPTKVSARQHMRLRFLLDHPEQLRGRRDFITALLERPGVGIEFVERWQAKRLTVAVVGLVFISLIASLLYAWITKDVSTAFTIGSYITSAFSVILVLVGILGFVDL